MSFPIELMWSKSSPNVVSKDISLIALATGTLRESTSIINPVITIDSELAYDMIQQINYAHIEAFHRYYFITNIVSVGYRLWQIDMHVDVLMTYNADIRKQSGIVERQQYAWNIYLDDGSFPAYQKVEVQKKLFSNTAPFENQSFVLIVAGPGGGSSPENQSMDDDGLEILYQTIE